MRPTKQHNKFDVLVLGGGFAGAFTAEALCDNGQSHIGLLEAGPSILPPHATSSNQCYKAHGGPHYIGDPETALTCLENSVITAARYAECFMDADKPHAVTRRGRHYLMENSPFGIVHTQQVLAQLTAKYSELLPQYPAASKIFGDPKQFITFLKPEDYPYVNTSIAFENADGTTTQTNVILGIETPESQVDIEKFRGYFREKFTRHADQLQIFTHHRVVNIRRNPDESGYIVEVAFSNPATNESETRQFYAKQIVNCMWNNIELFDKQLDLVPPEATNRLKVSVVVDVPTSLTDMNTCIFFAGPHVSVTRVGDDERRSQAILTYEPVTNAGNYIAGTPIDKIPDEHVRSLMSESLRADSGLGKEYATAIIAGAAKYIPELAECRPTEVRLGIVKNFAPLPAGYLFDKASPHHQRREDGVVNYGKGYVTFSAMKMTYAYPTALRVAQITADYAAQQSCQAASNHFRLFTQQLSQQDRAKTTDLERMLLKNMQL